MSHGDPEGDRGDHDRGRLRSARRLPLGGIGLGIVGALALGVAGGSGALGLVVLLLLTMVGCVLAAAHLAGFALVDELKGRPVATRRPIESVGFFVLALLLLLLVMGAAGAAGGTTDDRGAGALGTGHPGP